MPEFNFHKQKSKTEYNYLIIDNELSKPQLQNQKCVTKRRNIWTDERLISGPRSGWKRLAF